MSVEQPLWEEEREASPRLSQGWAGWGDDSTRKSVSLLQKNRHPPWDCPQT